MARARLRDVADAAGVHAATASRALNPSTRSMVSGATVDRVVAAAERLGYLPDPVARSLKTSRTMSIGIVVPDLTNPLFPPLIRGAEATLEGAGYDWSIVNTDNEPERERRLVESLLRRKVDGLLVATARREHPLLAELHHRGTVMVTVNRSSEELDVPSVTSADEEGIGLALSHLAALGHRAVAMVGGPTSTSTGLRRAHAFAAHARALDLATRPRWQIESASWTVDDGRKAMDELLASARPSGFTAVVAGNDLLALGCYDALAAHGMTVPRDMSVCGFNDMAFLDRLAVPLTSVRIPQRAMGEQAAELLLALVRERHSRDAPCADPATALSVELPVRLVPRASTGAPPVR